MAVMPTFLNKKTRPPPSLYLFTLPQGESTPTADFDVDASYQWNSQGDGLLMESLDYPVIFVTGDSKESIRERAASNGDIGKLRNK